MKPAKCPFNSIALDLIEPFQPSSKGNIYVLTGMCLLTNNPIAICTPDKTANIVIQIHLQHMYATFGGSFTLISDNGKEFNSELFQKVAKGASDYQLPSPIIPKQMLF